MFKALFFMKKNLSDLLNEHSFEHDLNYKKQYLTLKNFDADGNLNEHWYVYNSFRQTLITQLYNSFVKKKCRPVKQKAN